MKFIKVLAINGSHIIYVENIICITPYTGFGIKNKSSIKIKDLDFYLYSMETPEEIYIKIEGLEIIK